MAWAGPEGLVDEVKAYIDANFDAKRIALNAEYDDDVDLSDLAATYVGDRDSIPEYPAATIWIEDLAGDRVHGDYMDGIARLNVTTFVLDAAEEALERRVYRIVRAIVELLNEGQVANAITWRHTGGGLTVDYSPVFKNAGGMFLKGVQVIWTLKKQEPF